MQELKQLLLGTAIGDAFGLGLEFVDRDILREHIRFEPPTYQSHRTGDWAKNYAPGMYSDDTEHTIAVIKALQDSRPFSEELLLAYCKAEYESDKQRKGHPRQGHGTIKHWYEGRKTIEDIRTIHATREHPGCAPAMRAAPIGLLATEPTLDTIATINATATHPHPLAIDASIAIARAAKYLIVDAGAPQGLIPYVQQHLTTEKMHTYLTNVQALPPPDITNEQQYTLLYGPQPLPDFGITGVPSSAMHITGAALHILTHLTTPIEALKASIRIGGDVDSVAAITTGILSARYGLATIRQFIQGVEVPHLYFTL